MIIDFHTHIFPDKIANATIDYLMEKGGIPSFSNGSASGLISKMNEAGVDISVSLPAMTSPMQFDSINRYALMINEEYKNKDKRIISFGGIHPDCDDIENKMRFLKKSGFLGIKIHPDYQGTYINDERYVHILECAAEYDLLVITHTGVDVAYSKIHCTPALTLELIRRVPHAKLILAHMGANDMFDQAFDLLCGENVYLDTAYVLRFIGEDRFKKMLDRHGEDKILFASDSPWSDIKEDIGLLKSFDISETAKNKIFYENAKALLKI